MLFQEINKHSYGRLCCSPLTMAHTLFHDVGEESLYTDYSIGYTVRPMHILFRPCGLTLNKRNDRSPTAIMQTNPSMRMRVRINVVGVVLSINDRRKQVSGRGLCAKGRLCSANHVSPVMWLWVEVPLLCMSSGCGGICPSLLMSCMYCTFDVLYIYLRLLFGIACLAYNMAIQFALYQPLYPKFIVNSFDIKRAAATFAQFACTLHGKHK